MSYVLRFGDAGADEIRLVGGKGANLGRLTKAGFPVPAGFSVSTEGYQEFLAGSGLAGRIAGIVDSIDFHDVSSVDTSTAEIRGLIEAASCPPVVADELIGAYRELGDDVRVAVRSSGTAEDLEDASFAGQHDTYLHIRGVDGVVDAVKRCWASLWTARATAYRQHKGFGQEGVGIAVVVQTMVDAEVSGVMFTANPIKAVTDEIRINASWGLGEAVVSGLVTPDDFTLDLGSLGVLEKTVGAKEVRIRLDAAAGQGTLREDVPQSERDIFSLTDSQAAELGDLGRRVMAHYDGLPQDTEWALAGGTFHLLQSRPVTAANFSWDETIADWSTPDDAADTVWSRAWADEAWTGAVTPLFFSVRGLALHRAHVQNNRLYGFDDLARMRYQKYYRGIVYWNSRIDKNFVQRMLPPRFRPFMLGNISPLDHDETLNAPFSYVQMLRVLARVQALSPDHGVTAWLKVQQNYIDNRRQEAAGKTDDELRLLSDEALIHYTDNRVDFESKYVEDVVIGYVLQATLYGQFLTQVVLNWYDGDNPAVLIDLLTGAEKRTFTVQESMELWNLTKEIKASAELTRLFHAHPGAEFFDQLSDSEAGQGFLARYRQFVAEYGHRGQADRDIYFTRRAEDPAVDYRLLSAMLSVDAEYDPVAVEESANRKKRAAYESIVENLGKKPLGFLRVEIFKLLNAYMQKILIGRDDERGWVDISTFTIKRCFKELNRRIMARGLLDEDRDYFFLGRRELYDVFRGRANMPLTRAKIAGRKHNFDLVDRKDVVNPMYLQHNEAVQTALEEGDGSNLRGIPTSGGVATATARVVKGLDGIGTLRQGEILVCNSTDPGWTPVFLLLAGAVFETGGAFAHCSCLSREYGIPAVQVAGALHKIPDGATITVDGNTGTVTILDTPATNGGAEIETGYEANVVPV